MMSWIDLSEGIDVAKSSNSKECLKVCFLIMDLNFKVPFVMVAMIWQCCVLI